MIYHVTDITSWNNALASGSFTVPSLQTEGFIHASTREQVNGVIHRYYKNIPDLILLHIDESKLTASLKFELAPSINEMFPHIFGPINIDAVMQTEPL